MYKIQYRKSLQDKWEFFALEFVEPEKKKVIQEFNSEYNAHIEIANIAGRYGLPPLDKPSLWRITDEYGNPILNKHTMQYQYVNKNSKTILEMDKDDVDLVIRIFTINCGSDPKKVKQCMTERLQDIFHLMQTGI